jgi:glycogen operon protein
MVDLSERSLQLAYCLHGASQNDADIYVMINSADEAINFGIHEGVVGHWQRIIDTARENPEDILDSFATPVDEAIYSVNARSVVVLLRPNPQRG